MRRILSLMVIWGVASLAWAGDVAQFRILGFSPDGRYMDFASYGIDNPSGFPYAETHIVDVITNQFVPGTSVREVYSVTPSVGDDGFEALLAIYDRTSPERRHWRIDPLKQGRTIFYRVLSEDTQANYDNFDFLDYATGDRYQVSMHKTIETTATGKIQSKFFISLTLTSKTGQVRHLQAGHPNFIRPGVENYIINRILLSPNNRSLIFVIEREEVSGKTINMRNMVETLVL